MTQPATEPVTLFHALDAAAVAGLLQTDPDKGLSSDEANLRLGHAGPNSLPERGVPGPFRLILRQFASFLIAVLFVAAVVSLFLGDLLEAGAILVIALLNAVLGFVQEFRAEKALSALRALSAPECTVLRNGSPARIATSGVVAGDLLLLEAGDVVAADARVVEAISLAVNESILTGEAMPGEKDPAAVPEGTELGDRTSMLYQGTLVAHGRGRAIVVSTGATTEMGRIAGLVAGRTREDTPLQRELATVGRTLAGVAVGLALIVFVVAVVRGLPAGDMLVTAASLAVAAIPEGLPAASTIVLTLGVQRMAKRHVIVRRLSSVETLGAVTIIFTDKTGTLTLNQMSVTEVAPAEHDEAELLRAMVLCNNASLGVDGARDHGDPTEVALLAYAAEQGVKPAELGQEYRRELEFPFDPKRARMTVVVSDSRGRRIAYTKGAPEVILARSSHPDGWVEAETQRQAAQAKSTAMAARGIRVLAFAKRELGAEAGEDDIEKGFRYLGLIGLSDPLRAEAASSVRLAQDAGIQVAMLTGDQPATAQSIGRQVGLVGPVIHGRDIEELPLAQLQDRITEAPIFARVTSDHKMRIIEAARAQGQVVAMTGDGVNDAPALQAADIGVAMGAAGTDVAREASDMVLTDDNFHSIVVAVEEGRTIHANISRFIHFLLSCNAAEVGVVFLVLLLFGESVFTPLQILFVNLLTDGLPALALGVEPAEPGVMRRGPRPLDRRLISQRSLVPIGMMASFIGLTTIAGFVIGREMDGPELPASLAFATLVGSQLASSLVFRSETLPFLRLARNTWLLAAIGASTAVLVLVFALPVTRDAFDLAMLTPGQWLTVAGLSVVPLILGEASKLMLARRRDAD